MKTRLVLVESNDPEYLHSASNLDDSSFGLRRETITWEVKRIVICLAGLNFGNFNFVTSKVKQVQEFLPPEICFKLLIIPYPNGNKVLFSHILPDIPTKT